MIDLFEPGSQARRIVAVMMERPVNNHEMRDLGVLNYTARISDMRRILSPHGYTIEKERVVGRVYRYSLVPLPEPVVVKKPAIAEFFDHIMGFFGMKGVRT